MTSNSNYTEVNIKEITTILPHRYPFLLIDKVRVDNDNNSGTGIKNVTINEEFFQGHFPNDPIMPGVLIIESMAQSSAIVIMKKKKHLLKENNSVYFASISNTKFKKPVRPGDILHMYIEIINEKMQIFKVKGVAKVDEEIVAISEFSAKLF